MSDKLQVSGPAIHSAFVRTPSGLLLATARSLAVELQPAQGPVPDGRRGVAASANAVAALTDTNGFDLLAVGGADGRLKIYDPEQRELIHEQQLDNSEIIDLSFLKFTDETPSLAVLHENGIFVWRWPDGYCNQLVGSRPNSGSRPFRVTTFRAQDGLRLAAVYGDGSIAVWHLDRPEQQPTWNTQAHSSKVWTMITVGGHSPDHVLATGSADKTARIWSHVGNGHLRLARTFQVGSTVRRLAYLVDAGLPMLLMATAAGSVVYRRFDGPEDLDPREITSHGPEVWALAVRRRDDDADTSPVIVASGDQDGDTKIKNFVTNVVDRGTATEALPGRGTGWVTAAGRSGTGWYVATGGADGIARARLLATDERREFDTAGGSIRALAASTDPADPVLVTGGAQGRVIAWNPETGERRCELHLRHQGEVWGLALASLDGRTQVISGGQDGTIRMLPLPPSDVSTAPRPTILARGCGPVKDMVTVPAEDGPRLAVATERGLWIIPVAGTGPAVQLTGHPISAACLAYEADKPVIVTVRSEGGHNVFELFDPIGRSSINTFTYTEFDAGVEALAALNADADDVVIVAGTADGQVRVWHINGELIGLTQQAGPAAVRSLSLAELPGTPGQPARHALISVDALGTALLWPVAVGELLRGGGALGSKISARPILIQDQPSADDELSRIELVQTIRDVLTAPETTPPVVVGIHAPWGMGKSSVLRQLQHLLDPSSAQPTARPRNGTPPAARPGWFKRLFQRRRKPAVSEDRATHLLVPRTEHRSGRLRRKWQGGDVRTRLTRSWAWRQTRRQPQPGDKLPYRMQPKGTDRAITIWFNPWMFERPDQLWAGLTQEILQAIGRRLPDKQRERLWFDLNLRRTDPTDLRKRILASFLPETLLGMLGWPTILLIAVVAVVAGVVTTVESGALEHIFGVTGLIMLTVFGVLAQLGVTAFRQVRGLVKPSMLNRPTSAGVSSGSDNPNRAADGDPLEQSQTGYLYLLQHDVREVVQLASEDSIIVVFIDDLDRCSPPVVADTIEAINLFLNRVFEPCMFVIALDPSTVAAQLDNQFESITRQADADPISYGHLRHTGWRFMEKIIDLPIRLPRIRDAALDEYLDRLLDPTGRPDRMNGTPTGTSTAAAIPKQRRESSQLSETVKATATAARTSGAATSDTQPTPAVSAPGQRPEPDSDDIGTALARIETLERLRPVRAALRTAVRSLPQRNPRQTKAFLNLWRFYMVLEHRTHQLHYNVADLEQHSIEMARFVELTIRWPWLVDALGAHPGGTTGTGNLLTRLIDNCHHDAAWSDAVTGAGLNERDESMIGLRELLSRPGGNPPKFARIASRFL